MECLTMFANKIENLPQVRAFINENSHEEKYVVVIGNVYDTASDISPSFQYEGIIDEDLGLVFDFDFLKKEIKDVALLPVEIAHQVSALANEAILWAVNLQVRT